MRAGSRAGGLVSAVALWSAVMVSMPSLAAVGDPIGAPIRVAASSQDTHTYVSNPSIGLDATGNAVAAWIRMDYNSGDATILGQRFDANGVRVGAEFTIGPAPRLRQQGDRPTSLRLAMAPDGRFVVAWQSRNVAGAFHVRAFDAQAVPSTPDTLLPLSTSGSQDYPSIAIAPGGAFAVAWAEAETAGLPAVFNEFPTVILPGLTLASRYRIRVQRFESNAKRSGAAMTIDASSALLGSSRSPLPLNYEVSSPVVALDEDGALSVAWLRAGSGSGERTIQLRRYDSQGRQIGQDEAITPASTGEPLSDGPVLGVDRDRRQLVAWIGANQSISYQRFEASGAPNTPLISGFGGSYIFDPAIAVRPDGDFVLSFSSGRNDPAQVQFFDTQAAPRGAAAPIPGLANLPTSECVPAAGKARLAAVICSVLSADPSNFDRNGIYLQRYAVE